MPTTIKQQQIVDAVVTQLQTITTTNNYYTNIGNKIFEWLQRPITVDDLPCAIFRDVSANNISRGAGATSGNTDMVELEFSIQIITTSSSSASVYIRKAITDVEKSLGVDETLGGLVSGVDIDTRTIEIENQEEKIIIGGEITGIIFYQKTKFLET